ncbi:MAG: SDR family NAD(P)-dependent oxidoreductase [Proteobacteria bacterium]|nr:SDR family NAD(P)-dependent oxidoreductase [Pseudomonadota bacterium]
MKQKKSKSAEKVAYEPIALVGIGCRFPGGSHDPESFWNLLVTGSDAIVDIPPERWNLKRFYDPDQNKPGKMYVKQGGFLQQRVDEFDALFFGITPREAGSIDPQQRLLLETSWEALEDAGIPYESLIGSNTGVFIGAFTLDHKLTQMGKMNRDLISTHTAVGSTMTILSNRISYILDLRGPSMSVDTACSSSLVALHLACQAIWNGESDVALAGGVNVMMRPEYPIAMCKGGFLAPDGRSKSFDAGANGYGRGEGAGVVVLKPLSAALQDGDSIYALIRGTGVNQDGRTNGITVPNPASQTALIRSVCDKYGIDTNEISYFEAHGTGTPVGDPLEAKALGDVIDERSKRSKSRLMGSVKGAIGHLEAAAGIAGVIKTSLCLSHHQVPPQANLHTPNPNIPFEELGLRLPTRLESLESDSQSLYAAVNSFGYGGTNAHAVLENAPPVLKPVREEDATDQTYLLPLSARSEQALQNLTRAWMSKFPRDYKGALKDLCFSAACRRGHHDYRLAVIGSTWENMYDQLSAYLAGQADYTGAAGKTDSKATTKPVFVYTGMGPQWWAMGRELYENNTIYRETVEKCDSIFRQLAGWSILKEMLADEQNSKITQTEIAQPANFLVQAGLTAMWRASGIEPGAIVGHSLGEITAAYAAGALSLEDAIKVSYERSRILKKAAGCGKMLAVGVSMEYCAELIAKLTNGNVSIAAVNGPTQVTLSGDPAALEKISAHLTAQDEFNRFLQVELAYHSAFLEHLKPEIRQTLADLQPALPRVPLYSTVSGKLTDSLSFDAEYWCNNVREPVYFAQAMDSLLQDGYRIFLEVGPHPVLSTAIKDCCQQQNVKPQAFASLRRDQAEQRTFRMALAGLYTAGCNIDWKRLYPDDAVYVKLPTYPWQRETYWNEDQESVTDRTGTPVHALLDRRLSGPKPAWQSTVNRQFLPYLDDHVVDELVVMPGAAYVEAGLAAFNQATGNTACVIEQLYFHQALILSGNESEPFIHVSYDQENGQYAFHSHHQDTALDWTLHASAKILPAALEPKMIAQADIQQRCTEKVNVGELYAELNERGLSYGSYFRTIQQLQRGHNEVLAQIQLNTGLLPENPGYFLHPTMLDGCFQSLIAATSENDHFYMPVAIKRISYQGKPGNTLWCHGKLNHINEHSIEGELTLFDEQGNVLVKVEGLRCRALTNEKKNLSEQLAEWTYAWQWQKKAVPSNVKRKGGWLVFSDSSKTSETLCQELEVSGNHVIRVPLNEVYQQEFSHVHALNPGELGYLEQIVLKAKSQGCTGIAYLWGLAGTAHSDPAGIEPANIALQIIQLLGKVFTTQAPRVYVVTQGTQPVSGGGDVTNIPLTALTGLTRVALNEFPLLRCTQIDLDPVNADKEVHLLTKELMSDDSEDDVALRGQERYVHRWIRHSVELPSNERNGASVDAFRLSRQGRYEFHAMPAPLPGNDEVVVALQCINLTSYQLTDTNDGDVQGYFALGVIDKVGSQVLNRSAGELVMLVTDETIASHVVCAADQVFSVDQFQLSHDEIASLATTLVPAYYALKYVARVAPLEIVLIDGALGAAASAAVEVANCLGASPVLYHQGEDITCLENPEAAPVRAWIRSIDAHKPEGIEHLLLPETHEIVLTQSHTDRLPVSLLQKSFIHLDALKLALTAPDLFQQLLDAIAHLFSTVQIVSLPQINELTLTEGVAYLSGRNRSITDATQILSLQDKSAITVIDQQQSALFNEQAAYLITGGFGGFGLEAAKWMAKHGAKHLIMVSRRGASDDAAKAVLDWLAGKDVQVTAVAADLTDEAQVKSLFDKISSTCPSLKGIFHTAAILDDAPIAELTPERMTRVMRAKALSAWYLHQYTQNDALDFFVLFSSVSAIIGNARQANYAAANTFLDALAARRRAAGLAGTSINWGAIATGMAVNSEEVKKHLNLMGMNTITVNQSMDCWAQMRGTDLSQYGLMNCDWEKWQAFEPTGGNSPRFENLVGHADQKSENALTKACQEIFQLAPEQREEGMLRALAGQVASVLRIPMEKIDSEQSLMHMGVDSLMSAELQALINKTFGVRISTLELMRSPNLGHMAHALMEKTILSISPSTTADEAVSESSVIEHMSEKDIDMLLEQLLVNGSGVSLEISKGAVNL